MPQQDQSNATHPQILLKPSCSKSIYNNMTTTFQFIENNNAVPGSIDLATRRRIRSHAATGKNTGRKINRPSRIAALKSQQAYSQGRGTLGSKSIWDRCRTSLHDNDDEIEEAVQASPQETRRLVSNDQGHSSQRMWAMLAAQYETLHRVMGQGRAGLDFVLPVPLSCRTWALSTGSVGAAQRCE